MNEIASVSREDVMTTKSTSRIELTTRTIGEEAEAYFILELVGEIVQHLN